MLRCLRIVWHSWPLVVTFAVGACAPKRDRAAPRSPTPGHDAATSSTPALSAELGPLPPTATMPPPGVATSKRATVTRDAALATCLVIPNANANTKSGPTANDDLPARAQKLAEGCAAASGMTPLGPPVEGRQADKDRAAEQALRVEVNRCYRVYIVHDTSIRDAVVVARDSAGAVVATSAGAALPEDGAMCFTSADDVTLLVSVGAGEGRYATQVWRK